MGLFQRHNACRVDVLAGFGKQAQALGVLPGFAWIQLDGGGIWGEDNRADKDGSPDQFF